MIVSFRHKGLGLFFESGSLRGIQPHHAMRLKNLLAALDTAGAAEDMDQTGLNFHLLKEVKKPRWSIKVNENWRLTFELESSNAYVIDYEDYQ
ncbi:Killer protein [Pseudoduganella sp. FT55W]|uniref:Killer protein n=1 Tax=Duganella rivi TaxID=2666083 RepID=A0A7X4KCM8_9BURK|nr:type II toxin-antitoxin system RelE/ParE family toxin [Duganella rivi]MYM69396.1 Killer protein [Duganella rivi]